ncbi:MAG: hypothetical protein QF864_04295 [SAR202 cluster bacterium]|nr:hypothetical protein [SAR202 cluster bacterium]
MAVLTGEQELDELIKTNLPNRKFEVRSVSIHDCYEDLRELLPDHFPEMTSEFYLEEININSEPQIVESFSYQKFEVIDNPTKVYVKYKLNGITHIVICDNLNLKEVAKIVETKKEGCNCDIMLLMNEGCQCGGMNE